MRRAELVAATLRCELWRAGRAHVPTWAREYEDWGPATEIAVEQLVRRGEARLSGEFLTAV